MPPGLHHGDYIFLIYFFFQIFATANEKEHLFFYFIFLTYAASNNHKK